MKRYKAKFKNRTTFGGKLRTVFIKSLDIGTRPGSEKYNAQSVKYHISQVKHHKRLIPPVVEKTESGKFRVVDGWHRLKALQKLRIRKARVEVA